ncbi:MAG: alpha/beta hydrolase [Burkholderiaceae bacterium]
MSSTARKHLTDLRGATRLAIDATAGVTRLVEAMHATIARLPGTGAAEPPTRTRGITGLVYRSIHGVTRLVGGGLDKSLAALTPLLGEAELSPRREAVLAAANGVLGDHLAASANPLAIPMQFRHHGIAMTLEPAALAAAYPKAGPRLLVLLHGLCMNDLQWRRRDHDHGAALARDLGFTPVTLHYNSGLHIATNGQAFARLMEQLLEAWPVALDEVVLLNHSMGGLVARSAHHYASLAGLAWPQRITRQVFLGTPHLGAPLERGGNGIDLLLGANAYTAPLARLGKIRSAGITDLRHGSLLESDWIGRDRFEHAPTHPQTVPLPESIANYAIAASTGSSTEGVRARLIGDGLVPVASALGRHRNPARRLAFAPDHVWIGHGLGHFDLLDSPEVYTRLRDWLA